jgi:hypothetical protein
LVVGPAEAALQVGQLDFPLLDVKQKSGKASLVMSKVEIEFIQAAVRDLALNRTVI